MGDSVKKTLSGGKGDLDALTACSGKSPNGVILHGQSKNGLGQRDRAGSTQCRKGEEASKMQDIPKNIHAASLLITFSLISCL